MTYANWPLSFTADVEQDPFPFPFWLVMTAAVTWVVFIYGISILLRRAKGKAIFPRVPKDAIYAEKWASARWASNCLIVAVTKDTLSVVPRFPFNMGFLPEIYGLECTVPTRSIREVRRLRSFGLLNNVAVVYDDGVQRELRLKVRNPDRLIDALLRSPNIRISG